MDTTENKIRPFEFGRINLVFNTYYSNINNFVSKNGSNYTHNKYEVKNTKDFFGDDKHLHIKSYFGVNRNTYLISKLIDNGPIIFLYNPLVTVKKEESIESLKMILKIFKKNSPNCDIGVIIRDEIFKPLRNDLINEFKEILGDRFIDLKICDFSYRSDAQKEEECFNMLVRMIKNYFSSHPDNFIRFEDEKEILYTRELFRLIKREAYNASILTKHFLDKMLNQPENLSILLDKLIKMGFIFKINSKNINNLYFIDNELPYSIKNILLNIFDEYGTGGYQRTKQTKQKLTKYESEPTVISTFSLSNSIPSKFTTQIKNAFRLILIILRELKLGRIFGKKYIYIRRYKYDVLNYYHDKGIDFIYNLTE